MERRQYLAKCSGFASASGTFIGEHEYLSERPIARGSHGTCPNCARLYAKEIGIELEAILPDREAVAAD